MSTDVQTRSLWFKMWPAAEFAGEAMTLSCEEYGFLMRLRGYAWANGGIPDTEEFLLRAARTWHLSKYKLKKIWWVLENFFTKKDGFLFYDPDEQYQTQATEIASKRRVWGKLGAMKRWENHAARQESLFNGLDGLSHTEAMAKNGEPELDLDKDIGGPAAAYRSSSTVDHAEETPAAAAASPPYSSQKEAQPTNNQHHTELEVSLSEQEYKLIAARTIQLGMPAPGRDLAAKVRKIFNDLPVAEAIGYLSRFPDQDGPGLWVHKTKQELMLESARQQSGMNRKPNERDTSAYVLEALRRARAAQGR